MKRRTCPRRAREAAPGVVTLTSVALASVACLAVVPTAAQETDPARWRALDPEHSLYLELPGGRVVIELAPGFAPRHVANIRTLVRERYFDGLAVIRSQDNYVVQWGDPDGERSLGTAELSLEAELDRPITGDLPFTPLPDADVYAPEVGFTLGFPVARDPASGRTWIVHCYGVVGVARGNDPDSGSGAQLYAVNGHSPRHLDRNTTIVGRVVQGMEHLSTLPRGSGPLGFYEDPEEPVPIRRVRLGSELPPGERADLEVMRTDSPAFRERIEQRRTRDEEWFVEPTGRIEVCNVGVPVRSREEAPPSGTRGGTPADPSEQEAIRAARAASNRAIARHDVDAIVSFLDDDFQVTAGNGSLLRGRAAMAAGFRDRFAAAPDLRYVRTPDSVTVSSSAALAWEEGRWVGTSSGPGGVTRNGGRYAAQWRNVDGSWKIRSELFVTLFCEGAGCD